MKEAFGPLQLNYSFLKVLCSIQRREEHPQAPSLLLLPRLEFPILEQCHSCFFKNTNQRQIYGSPAGTHKGDALCCGRLLCFPSEVSTFRKESKRDRQNRGKVMVEEASERAEQVLMANTGHFKLRLLWAAVVRAQDGVCATGLLGFWLQQGRCSGVGLCSWSCSQRPYWLSGWKWGAA